jgi:branched-chain amino acid transport system substrate-binding protein
LLIAKDDRQDEQTALRVDGELIAEGVAAIVGHMTSAMSVAAVPLMNEKNMVMLSPTSTTSALTGKDDYFLRMQPATKAQTESLALHASQKAGFKRIAVIYDLANRSYTEDYFQVFSRSFVSHGGTIAAAETFTSGGNPSFSRIVSRMAGARPDAVLLIANAADGADICQQIRKTGSRVAILAAGWGMTGEFLQKGGKAAEGVVFDNFIDRDSRHPRYLRFLEAYRNRFGTDADFGAMMSYEAIRLIADALAVNEEPTQLKKTILGIDKVYGLFGDLKIDRFGEAKRESCVITVKNGRFQKLE